MTRATQSAQMLVAPLDVDGITAQVRIFQSGRSAFATVQVLCLGLRGAVHPRIRPVAIFRAIEALHNLRWGCHGALAAEEYGPEIQRLCTAATLTPQAACVRRRPMAGRRWRSPLPWQTGSGVTVAWAAVAVLVCGTARCPGAVGAIEGLRGPAVGRAAVPGRLNVRGGTPGACCKKQLGCVCGGVKRACFGFQGDKRPSCCAKCKLEGMVDIRNRRCNCGRALPGFGMPEDARASCCAKCKLEGMVDIRHRRCNCGQAQPSFGMPEDARPSCCSKCKLEGMVDIKSRRCNCGRAVPSFGMPEDARASCCAKCKLQGMVNIRHPRCSCGRSRPYFGMPEDTRASCCAKCKSESMVDIINPKCSVCGKHACYPDAFGKPRQLCAAHSAEVGAHVLSSPSWSRAASDCLDLLEEERGFEYPCRHRFDDADGVWSGEEFAGLVPDRAFRPDAHDPQRREIVEFLGNYYHGFPPEHPQHLSFTCVGGKTSPQLHRETFERLDLFLAQNLRVFYVWEHEFTEWQKLAARRCNHPDASEAGAGEAPPISRILHRHAKRSSKGRRTARKSGKKPAAGGKAL